MVAAGEGCLVRVGGLWGEQAAGWSEGGSTPHRLEAGREHTGIELSTGQRGPDADGPCDTIAERVIAIAVPLSRPGCCGRMLAYAH